MLDEWLFEIENFSTREERLKAEFDAGMKYTRLIEWISAAYVAGLNHSEENDNGCNISERIQQ